MSSKVVREPIRCLLSTQTKGKQTINEYMLKSGKYITEVITDLGQGQTGIREIFRNSSKANDVEKVVDKVFGRLEVFYPGRVGVIQEVDGMKCSMPDITIDKLIKVAQ